MNFSNSDQLKSFLKSEASRLGISVQNAYNTYFARILLERINRISYDELFVKGSFSEFGHVGKLVRPITDIDLVSLSNKEDALQILFYALYEANQKDNVVFELRKPPYQTNTGIIKIPFVANFGRIEHDMSIDYQENSNTIYEKQYKVIKPIFTGDGYFGVCMPTIEEYIAEKLCIVIENNKSDVLNTRVKDFYDIWKLLECPFSPSKVAKIFRKMIIDRQKTDPDNLDPSFLNNEYILKHQQMWDDISQKYEFLDKSVEFPAAVKRTKQMLNHEVHYYNKTMGRK